jgi:hypothetical protein
MQGNFEKKLELSSDGLYVIAKGPLDQQVANVKLICAWVIQRGTEGKEDAICNNMAVPGQSGVMTMGAGDTSLKVFDRGTPNANWEFKLADRDGLKDVRFEVGPAWAVAIAVFEDSAGNQCALSWQEGVELIPAGTLTTM